MNQNYMGTDRPTITKKDVPVVFTKIGMFGLLAWCIFATMMCIVLNFSRPTPTDIAIALPLGLIMGIVTAPMVVDYAAWMSALKSRCGSSGYMSEVRNLKYKENPSIRFQIVMMVNVIGVMALIFGILHFLGQAAPSLVKPSTGLAKMLHEGRVSGNTPFLLTYFHALAVYMIVLDLALVVVAPRVVRWYNELPD